MALPPIAYTTGTKLSDTEWMSSNSASDAEEWYAPITMSALVLNASNRSSTVSMCVMNQMSDPRTLIVFMTLSENVLSERLSRSTTTAGDLSSERGIDAVASSNGTGAPTATGRTPSNQAGTATSPSARWDAKIAGMSI